MNMIEAFTEIKKQNKEKNFKNWARPVAWRHLQIAFNLNHYGDVMLVPNSNGVIKAPMPCLSVLQEEWEIVSVHDVVNGK